jgi:hypothetical protein
MSGGRLLKVQLSGLFQIIDGFFNRSPLTDRTHLRALGHVQFAFFVQDRGE